MKRYVIVFSFVGAILLVAVVFLSTRLNSNTSSLNNIQVVNNSPDTKDIKTVNNQKILAELNDLNITNNTTTKTTGANIYLTDSIDPNAMQVTQNTPNGKEVVTAAYSHADDGSLNIYLKVGDYVKQNDPGNEPKWLNSAFWGLVDTIAKQSNPGREFSVSNTPLFQ